MVNSRKSTRLLMVPVLACRCPELSSWVCRHCSHLLLNSYLYGCFARVDGSCLFAEWLPVDTLTSGVQSCEGSDYWLPAPSGIFPILYAAGHFHAEHCFLCRSNNEIPPVSPLSIGLAIFLCFLQKFELSGYNTLHHLFASPSNFVAKRTHSLHPIMLI